MEERQGTSTFLSTSARSLPPSPTVPSSLETHSYRDVSSTFRKSPMIRLRTVLSRETSTEDTAEKSEEIAACCHDFKSQTRRSSIHQQRRSSSLRRTMKKRRGKEQSCTAQ